jgi:SAM-dependent methyltransferase
MATQYPECYFTAVEIVPDSLQALPMLPNIAFDREPYQQGLNFADNSIDYIHLRSMGYCVGLQNWNALMKEVYRILKPDGLIRIEEIDHSVGKSDFFLCFSY